MPLKKRPHPGPLLFASARHVSRGRPPDPMILGCPPLIGDRCGTTGRDPGLLSVSAASPPRAGVITGRVG
jgi:hypothetical protein